MSGRVPRLLVTSAFALCRIGEGYFDDVFGYGWTDFMGPRAAIDEFNQAQPERKLGKVHGLRFELPPEDFQQPWHEKLYVLHVFDHPRYADFEGRIDERWLQAHRLDAD